MAGTYSDTIAFGLFTLISNNGGAFLVKYNPNGNVIWAQNGKNGAGEGTSVVVDNLGNIYLTGAFSGTITFGAFNLVSSGRPTDVFLVKYDSSGNVLWAQSGKTASSHSSGISNAVTTDKQGNIYITGNFYDTIAFGSYKLTTYSAPGSVFIAKYDSSGNLKWAVSSITPNLVSDPLYNASYSVLTDKANNIYITGQFIDSIAFGSYKFFSPHYNIFLVKYDSTGNVIWAQKGTGLIGIGYSLSTDKWNNLYLGGSFDDTITFGAVTLPSSGAALTCIIMFDTSGKALCGSSADYENDDAYAIAADPWGGSVYLGADIPGASTCIFGKDTISGTGDEYSFIAKWQPCNAEEGINPINPKTENSCLFPNPNNGKFTIQSSGISGQSSVEIYNVFGEKVYSQFNIQNSTFNIDLSPQPNGIYLYRLLKQDGELIGSGKVVIAK